jgi:uncharacterized protein
VVAAPLAGQPAAVPPPVAQQTADCVRPVYATDQLVCGDPALKALDAELVAALEGFVAPASAWFEPQEAWFKRRSRCAFAEDHAVCAAAAYRERLAVVRPADPDLKPSPARCNDRAVTAVVLSGDRMVLIGADGRPLGAALADKALGSWQPFLTIASPAPRLKLKAQSGQTLACRMARADK